MARSKAASSGVLGRLQGMGFARGVLGRSGPWFWVWAGLWLLGKMRARAGTEVLLSERLEPGQRIVISNDRATIDNGPLPVRRGRGGRIRPIREPKPSRRARRKARRAAR